MITIALRSKTEAAGVVAIDTHSDMRRAMVKILNVVTAYGELPQIYALKCIADCKQPEMWRSSTSFQR